MNNQLCAICNQPMDLIPAGVSRNTGKPYPAFYACKDKSHKQPYGSANNAPQAQISPNSATPAPTPNVDWDKISWGKCKTLFLVEAFKYCLNNPETVDPGSGLKMWESIAEEAATMSMRKLNELKTDEQGNNYVEGDAPPFN